MGVQLWTKNHYDMFVVSSALQKAIRRNDPRVAGWAGIELFRSGYYGYAWRRLLLISAEDCDGLVTSEVDALMRAQGLLQAKAKKGEPAGILFLVKAILILCRCAKNRDADHLLYLEKNKLLVSDEDVQIHLDGSEPLTQADIPLYVFDVHTRQGRQSGKTKDEFWKTEQDALNPKVPGLFDDIEILGGVHGQ